MVVIALDTSHSEGSMAAARDGTLLSVARFGEPRSHLAGIGPSLARVLDAASVSVDDIGRVAVVIGPGSFTGLRIGLAFAKGLAAGVGVGVVAVNTLELLAWPFLDGHPSVCSMVDARRGEVYAAVYRRPQGQEGDAGVERAEAVIAPCAADPGAFLERVGAAGAEPSLFVGTGVGRFADRLGRFAAAEKVSDPDGAYPSTAYLATVAHRLDVLEEERVRSLEPLYLRASYARRKKLRRIDP